MLEAQPQDDRRPIGSEPCSEGPVASGIELLLSEIDRLQGDIPNLESLSILTEKLGRLTRICQLGGYDLEGQHGGESLACTLPLTKGLSAFAVSPNGRWLVVAEGSEFQDSRPTFLSIFDLNNRESGVPSRCARFELDEFIYDLKFGPCGERLAFGSSKRAGIIEFNDASGTVSMEGSAIAIGAHRTIAFNADGTMLACGSAYYRAQVGAITKVPDESGLVFREAFTINADFAEQLMFSPCGEFVVGHCGGRLCRLAHISTISGKLSSSPVRTFCQTKVLAMASDPGSNLIAIAEADSEQRSRLSIHQMQSDGGLREICSHALEVPASALSFSTDGRLLAVGLRNKGALILEVIPEADQFKLREFGSLNIACSPNLISFLPQHGQLLIGTRASIDGSHLAIYGRHGAAESQVSPAKSFGTLPSLFSKEPEVEPEAPDRRSRWRKIKDWFDDLFTFGIDIPFGY
jgi:hypothetical protein